MKTLLAAVKAAVDGAGWRTQVAADPDHLPESRKLPVVVLTDAGETPVREGLNETTTELRVQVAVYHAVADDEKAVLGGGHRQGVLEAEQQVRELLADNDLGLADIEDAWPEAVGAVEYFGNEREVFARKAFTMVYRRVDT